MSRLAQRARCDADAGYRFRGQIFLPFCRGLVLVTALVTAPGSAFSAEEPAPAAPAQGAPDDARVSLDYRDADLSNVLRSLSYTYNLNLVTSSDVKGKVTVSLKDVTIDEALEAILSANELTFTRRGNIVYIAPIKEKEEIETVSAPLRLNYLKVNDAQNLLRKALSPKGDIRVDEMTNMLVVTDLADYVEQVKALLAQVDAPPQQVMIEAKLVDITSQDLHNIGLTWNFDYSPSGESKGLFNRKTQFQEQMEATYSMAGGSTSLDAGQLSLDTLTLKGLSVNATLDALVQDQKAHLLASPSIAVLNNQEARIVIGEKVPFKERTQTTTGTTETTKFIDVGTTLRVTPSINTDGYITMRIHPEVSSVANLLDAGPRITTREADTTVRIREGETIVIAGLIKQEDNRVKSGIPVLGSIPVLEYVFGSRSKDQLQTELAIFITPTILRSLEEQAALSLATVQGEEARMPLQTTGELSLAASLFDTAQKLESGQGLESRRKPEWFRMKQAVNLYENLAADFPKSPKAAEALYRAAFLRVRSFNDFQGARVNLQQLLKRYPNSTVSPRASDLLRSVDRLMKGPVLQDELREQVAPVESSLEHFSGPLAPD